MTRPYKPIYRESAPPEHLRRAIECCWSIETAADGEYPVPPDGCVDIIFQRGQSLRAVGAMTATQQFSLATRERLIGLRFRPGMATPFFGLPLNLLTDTAVDLKDLWKSRATELLDRLHAEEDTRRCAALLYAALTNPQDMKVDPVQQAIEHMTHHNGQVDLASAAKECNLSIRHFRRRCLEETGLRPKQLCRILRFRRAQTLAYQSSQPNWTQIALDAGYFDQAHLIRDFQEFAGATPMSLLSNRLDR